MRQIGREAGRQAGGERTGRRVGNYDSRELGRRASRCACFQFFAGKCGVCRNRNALFAHAKGISSHCCKALLPPPLPPPRLPPQAREYLHYRVFGERHITPVAIMTSAAKRNHWRVSSLLQQNNFFGRGANSFRLFEQVRGGGRGAAVEWEAGSVGVRGGDSSERNHYDAVDPARQHLPPGGGALKRVLLTDIYRKLGRRESPKFSTVFCSILPVFVLPSVPSRPSPLPLPSPSSRWSPRWPPPTASGWPTALSRRC